MNNKDIITALYQQISTYPSLSYVKRFLLGNRQADSITQYPTILIEPTLEQESQEVYNLFENKLFVQVVGFINVIDPEKQLIGDENTKGIFDFVNDVKESIDSDYTLGGKACHIVIKDTNFTSELYPVRVFALDIEVWFRQIKGNRK